jgi:lysophospholipase L1-like esterase
VDETTSPKRWTGKRLLLTVLTYAVTLLLVEGAVRVTHPEAGRPMYPGYPVGMVVPDGDLGHGHAPSFEGFFPQPRYRDIPILINSYGFRDVEWSGIPDPARPRIMVLGDSVVFGSPIRAEERFTEQAAAVLATRGRPVEFCNCGVNGYNIEQYDILTRQVGLLLAPRLVLVGLCLNDAEPLSRDDAKIIARSRAIREGSTGARFANLAGRYRLDLGQSYAWNLARRVIESRLWQSASMGQKKADEYTEKTKQGLIALYNGDGAGRLRDHFSSMKSFAGETLRADFGVVIFAYQHQVRGRDPALTQKVEALLKDLNIPYVNLYDSFLPFRDRDDLYAFQDDCHPSAFGHKIAGEATAALVESLLK